MNITKLKSANILIVDDKQSNIDLLTGFLDDEGYANYTSTTDPRKVAELFEEFKPDLILLDLHMPHMSGFQVMEQLKGLIQEDDYFPILILTADATTETKLKALAAGAKDFLSKPFDLTEVELRIKNLLLTRSMNIQLKNQNLILEDEVEERTLELKNTIVELIAAKEKAEESDRLKTAFLNNVSHEIRTPMNAIVGFSGFLNYPDLKPEKRKYYTDIIIQSSDQLLAIIDDIIRISSIDAGQEKIQENEININLICKLINEQFSAKANDKHITLRLKNVLTDDKAMIITDATKLTQILSNLIGNALKFTHEGYVNFGCDVKDNQLEFYVEDSGIGISLDMQEKIFARFRQVETTASRYFGGSGLGLSISKAYTEMLGGTIWLTSELGKGSIFYFTIPYVNANKNKLSDIPFIEGFNMEFSTAKTLLIAEDEDSNFVLLEEMLADSGINISRVVNGLEAVEQCKSNPYIDLVLMDIKMPEMDGYDAITRIKEFMPDLPIIAQTAYVTVADRTKAMAIGCADFISKPINKTLLLSKIYGQLQK